MKRHFAVKLMALFCFASVVKWNEVFVGDSLRDLSSDEFTYLKNFYGIENLRITSEYIYEDDLDYLHDFDDSMFGCLVEVI